MKKELFVESSCYEDNCYMIRKAHNCYIVALMFLDTHEMWCDDMFRGTLEECRNFVKECIEQDKQEAAILDFESLHP